MEFLQTSGPARTALGSLTVAELRRYANRFFAASSIFLFFVCVFVAWVGDQDGVLTALVSGTASIAALLGIRLYAEARAARFLVAVSFAVQVMALIFAASRLAPAFVEEAHMIFFVLNCYLLAYACWRSLAIYNALVILHHLVLNFTVPAFVWSAAASADGTYHLVVHALVIVILVGPLMWTAEQIKRTIESNEWAFEQAMLATGQSDASAARALEEQAKAERRAAAVEETAGGLDGRLKDLLGNILDAAVQVGQSARSVAAVSQTCGANTSDVDQSMGRAAHDIAAVAQSAEELASSVVDIARRADDASMRARDAVEASKLASERVEALIVSGKKVGDVTRIIRNVADSINLLALNATIESARAGEAGRGFAVVAQNVKELAGQTRRATEDIARQIASIQQETIEAVSAIKMIGSAVASAHEDADGIALSTAEQKAMTTAIAHSASAISKETGMVRQQVAAILSLLATSNAMSQDLLGASGGLSETAQVSVDECGLLLRKLRSS